MHSGWVSPALENATRTHMTAVLADIEVIHNNLYLSSDRCNPGCMGVPTVSHVLFADIQRYVRPTSGLVQLSHHYCGRNRWNSDCVERIELTGAWRGIRATSQKSLDAAVAKSMFTRRNCLCIISLSSVCPLLLQLTAEAPSVKYVMINGPYVVQYAFNASSALLLAQLDNQYNTMVSLALHCLVLSRRS